MGRPGHDQPGRPEPARYDHPASGWLYDTLLSSMNTIQLRLSDAEMHELRYRAELAGVAPTRYATLHLIRGLQRALLRERAPITSGPSVVASDGKVDEAALMPYTPARRPRATINWSTGRMDAEPGEGETE